MRKPYTKPTVTSRAIPSCEHITGPGVCLACCWAMFAGNVHAKAVSRTATAQQRHSVETQRGKG